MGTNFEEIRNLLKITVKKQKKNITFDSNHNKKKQQLGDRLYSQNNPLHFWRI